MSFTQSGEQLIGNKANGLEQFTTYVEFPEPFAQPPIVHVTMKGNGAFDDVLAVAVVDTTNDGFTVAVRRVVDESQHSTWSQELSLYWLAKSPDDYNGKVTVDGIDASENTIILEINLDPHLFSSAPHVILTGYTRTIPQDDIFIVHIKEVLHDKIVTQLKRIASNHGRNWVPTSQVEVNYSLFNSIQSNTYNIKTADSFIGGHNNSDYIRRVVQFNSAFPVPPLVVVTPRLDPTSSDEETQIINVQNVTPTSFTAIIRRIEASRLSNLYVSYVAILPALEEEKPVVPYISSSPSKTVRRIVTQAKSSRNSATISTSTITPTRQTVTETITEITHPSTTRIQSLRDNVTTEIRKLKSPNITTEIIETTTPSVTEISEFVHPSSVTTTEIREMRIPLRGIETVEEVTEYISPPIEEVSSPRKVAPEPKTFSSINNTVSASSPIRLADTPKSIRAIIPSISDSTSTGLISNSPKSPFRGRESLKEPRSIGIQRHPLASPATSVITEIITEQSPQKIVEKSYVTSIPLRSESLRATDRLTKIHSEHPSSRVASIEPKQQAIREEYFVANASPKRAILFSPDEEEDFEETLDFVDGNQKIMDEEKSGFRKVSHQAPLNTITSSPRIPSPTRTVPSTTSIYFEPEKQSREVVYSTPTKSTREVTTVTTPVTVQSTSSKRITTTTQGHVKSSPVREFASPHSPTRSFLSKLRSEAFGSRQVELVRQYLESFAGILSGIRLIEILQAIPMESNKVEVLESIINSHKYQLDGHDIVRVLNLFTMSSRKREVLYLLFNNPHRSPTSLPCGTAVQQILFHLPLESHKLEILGLMKDFITEKNSVAAWSIVNSFNLQSHKNQARLYLGV
jgi:hypothetical protein